jgi:enoyl-CoA hydratase/carnithine racemase
MSLVLTDDQGAVRHVVLNRPDKRNALHLALVEEIGAALRAAGDDPAVRVVVIRGAGPVLSGGMDLAALGELGGDGERTRALRRACLEAWSRAEEMPKPVICAVHGACVGGALEFALACDLRVMAREATIGVPEVRLGLIPDLGGSSRLPQVVGLGRAKELVMTGRMIGGEEAERIGLVNRAVPAGELDAAVQGLADELLACGPLAVGAAKHVLDASARPALAATLRLEGSAQEGLVRSEDFVEGLRALGERRAPRFSGR